MYNTGIYIRISQEDKIKNENESASIINQRNYLLEFINRQSDLKFIKEYTDDGYTGTNFERPGFNSMLEDIDKGKINCIVVKDLSRLGREYINSGMYIEKIFPEKGVRFIAVNDNFDTNNNINDFIIPIKNVFNELYSKDISKKCSSILREKKKNGEFIGAFACYGYKKSVSDKHKLVIDPHAGIIVQRIFKMYLDGMGAKKIAEVLNSEHELPPMLYKNENGLKYNNGRKIFKTLFWSSSTVLYILKNEMYAGNMVQNKSYRENIKTKRKKLSKKDWIIVKNTHEPLIDYDKWAMVQELLKKRNTKTVYGNSSHILSGLIVCGHCKMAMCRCERKSGAYFMCGTYKRLGKQYCIRNKISAEKVMIEVNNYLKNHGAFKNKNYYSVSKKILSNIEMGFNNKLYNIKELKKRLLECFLKGIISENEMKIYMCEYEKMQENIKKSLSNFYKEKKENNNENIITREKVGEFINKISVLNSNDIFIVGK